MTSQGDPGQAIMKDVPIPTLQQVLPFACGQDNLKVFHVSFPNLLCMLQVTSSGTSSIMAEKQLKWLIYCDFSHFTSIF